MELLSDILEHELGSAFEVKNEGSLRRCVGILAERLAGTERNDREHADFREAITKIDTRIEEGFKRMDQRFEAVDKRFEEMQHTMESRFLAVDRRFEDMRHTADKRFEEIQQSMDKRFEETQHGMDRRFESMDRRFDEMSRRFDMMFRFVSLGFILLATLMSIYQFLC